jgi:hypothetical protein
MEEQLLVDDMESRFQAYVEKQEELISFYGRGAGKQIIDRTSKHYVRIGAGVEEFLKEGNDFEYPLYGGSIQMLSQYAENAQFGVVDPENEMMVFGTGRVGARRFHNWIISEFGDSAIIDGHEFYTEKTSPTGPIGRHQQNYAYSNYFFNEYRAPGWGRIKIEYWPHLDDREINTLIDPTTGLPATSGDFIALSYGPGFGENSNIYHARRRGSNIYTYITYAWSPVGGMNAAANAMGFHSSGKKRTYELIKGLVFGDFIADVDKVTRFRPGITR